MRWLAAVGAEILSWAIPLQYTTAFSSLMADDDVVDPNTSTATSASVAARLIGSFMTANPSSTPCPVPHWHGHRESC